MAGPSAAFRIAVFLDRLTAEKVQTEAQGIIGKPIPIKINLQSNAIKEIRSITQELKSQNQATKQSISGIEDFAAKTALAGKRFLAFTAATAVFFKLSSAISSAVKDASDFETELLKIKQVSRESDNAVNGLGKSVFDVSKNLGVSSKEVLGVGLTLAQAGRSIEQITQSLRPLAKTRLAATFGDITNTVDALIAAQEQFGISAEKTESVLGTLNILSARYAVEAEDLTVAIQKAGGAFAAIADLDQGPERRLHELLSLFTAVRSTTRESADTIATGLRTIFARIRRPETIDALGQFGINLQDASGKLLAPLQAIKEIARVTKDLKPNDIRLSQIVEEVGGIRQQSKVIPLLQQVEKAEKALIIATQGANSLTRDQEIAQTSLANQLARTKQEFIELITKGFRSGEFRAVIGTINEMAQGFLKLTEAVAPVIPALTALATIKLFQNLPAGLKSIMGELKRTTTGTTLTKKTPGKMNGGPIRFNSGGQYNSLVEPNEYIFSADRARKIGKAKLDQANRDGTGLFELIGNREAQKSGRVVSGEGFVPGHGRGDTVPANLEKDQYVIRNHAIKKAKERFVEGGQKFRNSPTSKQSRIGRGPSPRKSALVSKIYEDKLDTDEKNVVSNYIFNSNDIQETVLGKKVGDVENVKNLYRTVNKRKLKDNFITYHGLDDAKKEDILSQVGEMKQGKSFTLKGFTSTSFGKGLAQNTFAHSGTVLRIRNFKGQPGLVIGDKREEITGFPSEQEVLLPPRQSFHINKVISRPSHQEVYVDRFNTGGPFEQNISKSKLPGYLKSRANYIQSRVEASKNQKNIIKETGEIEELIGAGTEGMVFRKPTGNVVRVGLLGQQDVYGRQRQKFERPKNEYVLQAIKSKVFDDFTVEELPFADSVDNRLSVKEETGRITADKRERVSNKIRRIMKKHLTKSGFDFEPEEITPGNTGVHEGKFKILDPNIQRKFNKGGTTKQINCLLEPGEQVFSPKEVSRIGKRRLEAYNYADKTGIELEYPLKGFRVPGTGRGDKVPMQLPKNSFVLRKDAVDYLKPKKYKFGGSVGTSSVQKFADGGNVTPGKAAAGLGILLYAMPSLINKTEEFGDGLGKVTQALVGTATQFGILYSIIGGTSKATQELGRIEESVAKAEDRKEKRQGLAKSTETKRKLEKDIEAKTQVATKAQERIKFREAVVESGKLSIKEKPELSEEQKRAVSKANTLKKENEKLTEDIKSGVDTTPRGKRLNSVIAVEQAKIQAINDRGKELSALPALTVAQKQEQSKLLGDKKASAERIRKAELERRAIALGSAGPIAQDAQRKKDLNDAKIAEALRTTNAESETVTDVQIKQQQVKKQNQTRKKQRDIIRKKDKNDKGIVSTTTSSIQQTQSELQAIEALIEQQIEQLKIDPIELKQIRRDVKSKRGGRTDQLRKSQRLQTFGFAGAATANAFGGVIGGIGEERLTKTNGKEGQSAFIGGSALAAAGEFAAVGAAIGSAIPVIGTAAGAIVGGVGGLIYGTRDAFNKANKLLSEANLEEGAKKLQRTIEKLNDPIIRLSPVLARNDFISQTKLTESAFFKRGDKDTRDRAENLSLGTQEFLNTLTKSIEFDKNDKRGTPEKAESALTKFKAENAQLISFVSRFTGQTFKELDEGFKRLITENLKNKTVENVTSLAQRREDTRAIQAQGIINVLGDVEVGLNEFEAILNREVTDLSGVFKRLGQVSDIELFNRALGQASNRLAAFGESGTSFVREAQAINDVGQKLPTLVVDVFSKSQGREGFDDLFGEFSKELDKLIPKNLDEREFIKGSILSSVGELNGRDDIAKHVRTNLSEILKPIQDKFSQIGQVLSDSVQVQLRQNTLLQGQFKKLDELRQQQIDANLANLDLTEELATRQSRFGRLPVQESVRFDTEKLRNISGQANNEPGVLGVSLRVSQDKLDSIVKELSSATPKDTLRLNEARQRELTNIERATRALKFMADATNRTAKIEEEIGREKQLRETKRGILQEFAFGNPESRRNLGRSITATNVAVQRGTLTAIPSELRSDVLSLLDRMGEETKIQGKSVLDIKRGLIEDDIRRSGGLQTFGGEAGLQEFLKSIFEKSTNEKKLETERNDLFKRAITSNDELSLTFKSEATKLTNSINAEFPKFVDRMEILFTKQQETELGLRTSKTIGERDALGKRVEKVDTLKGLLKGTDFADLNEQSVSQLRSILPKITEKEGLLKQSKALDSRKVVNFGKPTDFITKEAAKELVLQKRPELESQGFSPSVIDSIENNLVGQINGIFNLMGKGGKTRVGILSEAFNSVVKAQAESQKQINKSKIEKIETDLSTEIKKPEELEIISSNIGEINKVFTELGNFSEIISSTKLNESYNKLNDEVKQLSEPLQLLRTNLLRLQGIDLSNIAQQIGIGPLTGLNKGGFARPLQFANGSFVPGSGNRDTVPAMLTPGEFVIRKQAAEALGGPTLNYLNSFNKGGKVQKFAKGGDVQKSPLELFAESKGKKLSGYQAKQIKTKSLRERVSDAKTSGKKVSRQDVARFKSEIASEVKLNRLKQKEGNKQKSKDLIGLRREFEGVKRLTPSQLNANRVLNKVGTGLNPKVVESVQLYQDTSKRNSELQKQAAGNLNQLGNQLGNKLVKQGQSLSLQSLLDAKREKDLINIARETTPVAPVDKFQERLQRQEEIAREGNKRFTVKEGRTRNNSTFRQAINTGGKEVVRVDKFKAKQQKLDSDITNINSVLSESTTKDNRKFSPSLAYNAYKKGQEEVDSLPKIKFGQQALERQDRGLAELESIKNSTKQTISPILRNQRQETQKRSESQLQSISDNKSLRSIHSTGPKNTGAFIDEFSQSIIESLGPELKRKISGGQRPVGFNKGGGVGNQTQTSVKPLMMSLNPESLSSFEKAVQAFSQPAMDLAKAISTMPTEITLSASHVLDVHINGAEAFGKMKEEMSSLILEKTKQELNKLIDLKFPTVGRIA